MEGKNCFRTQWSQVPLYSGGNIASLRLPVPSGDECLVVACGDTINVLRASSGDLLASYTLPLEDVILRVDAVSIQRPNLPRTEELTERKDPKRDDSGKKTRGKKPSSTTVSSTMPLTAIPHGSYIAVGTRSLQICVLRLNVESEKSVSSSSLSGSAKIGDGDVTKVENDEEEKTIHSDDIVCSLTPVRSWTAAQQAISVVHFTPNGRYLVSGSTDGGVKVWDVFSHHLTHNLRLPSASLVHAVYVDPTETFLCVGSFEGHVAIFDFTAKQLRSHGRPHVAAVEALCMTPDGEHVFSVGRDRTVAICGIVDASAELRETRAVVVKDHVTSAVFESPFRLHTGASDGTVSTYSMSVTEALCLTRRLRGSGGSAANDRSGGAEEQKKADEDEEDNEAAVRCVLVAGRPKGTAEAALLHGLLDDGVAPSLFAADAAFTITRVEPDGPSAYRAGAALVGFLDQVLDARALPPGCGLHRVVVTNSRDVRCYGARGCLSAVTLRGHSDIVLCCDVCPAAGLVATAGKDRDVRLWSTASWAPVAVCRGGHEADVTAVAFASCRPDGPSGAAPLLFSAGADSALRVWDTARRANDMKSDGGGVAVFFPASGISAAHEGPIHALAVAPKDQYVAAAGKDKHVSLWTLNGKRLFRDATLKGHRRGVSALAFSPTDRVLASSSNDGTVRLWSLVSLTCVKTLQADRAPVLQVAFFNAGTQLVTGNAEGVLRVWALAAGEAVWAGEAHEDKVWALSVVEDAGETVVLSGSADGVFVATEDFTAEEAARVRTERHEVILREQELANAMRRGKFAEAFMLALRLNHPRHLRQVMARWSAQAPQECEDALRAVIVPALDEEQLVRLLQFTREWVTNARHCGVASIVMQSVLAAYHFTALAAMPATRAILEALLAYMQRHSQRLHELLQRTYYVDYVTRALGPPTLSSSPPFATTKSPAEGIEAVASLRTKRQREEKKEVVVVKEVRV